MSNFQLLNQVLGYFTRPDETNTDDRYLVSGSQNIIINDQEKFGSRGGFTLDGPVNTALNGNEGSFDWDTQVGGERNLRSNDDELEVRFKKADDSIVYVRVADGFSAVDFSFTKYWDLTETLEILIFVNGDSNLREWSGGIAEVASSATGTITKKGTNTWAQEGFYTVANRTIIIDGTEFAYTGGEGTTTLTGVTPDASGLSAGDVATQKIITTANKPSATSQNDGVRSIENYLFVGDERNNVVEVSKNTDYTDFSVPSSPRIAGEAETLQLDSPFRGFGVLQRNMIIFSGLDDMYKTDFQQLDVGGTLSEILKVVKLKVGSRMGVMSRDFIAEIGTGIAYLSNEPALRILESAEDIENPLLRNVSINIKPDFDAEVWTNGHIKFNDNRIYLTAPTTGRTYILQFMEDENGNITRFWQTPQILPIGRIAIIGGVTHGHSSVNPETYKLFDGTQDKPNDETLPFNCKALLAYRSFDQRHHKKTFDEYLVELKMSVNTVLDVRFNYDFQGSTFIANKEIDASNEDFKFGLPTVAGQGQVPLGQNPLGGAQPVARPKYRPILETAPQDFYEFQTIFETDGVDQQWEILAHGPNTLLSANKANELKI